MANRALAGTVAMLATSALLYTFYDRFWYPPDEGNYAHVAQRIVAGDTLNLDVQDIHPGYINFVNAAALRLFGPDLLSLRYPLVVIGLLQAAVLFLVFPRDLPWRTALAAVGLTGLGAIQFLNPTAHWYCLALVVLLSLALARGHPKGTVTVECPRPGAGQLIAVGVLLGAIALFRQLSGFLVGIGTLAFLLWEAGERGTRGRDAMLARAIALIMAAALALYLVLATDASGIVLFGIWPLLLLALLVVRPQAPTREAMRLMGGVAAGIAVAMFPLAAYHAWHGSLQAWANDVGPTAVALTRLEFFDRSNFGALVFHAVRQIVTGRDAPTLLNGLYWAALPLVAAINGLVALRVLRRDKVRALPPLAMIAVFYAVVSVHFQVPVYLYYTAGLSLASLLALAPHLSVVTSRTSVALALVLAATGVYFHAGQPATRTVTAVLRGQRTPVRASTLRHASLRIDPDEADRYSAIVALICGRVPSDGTIFAVPSNAELYFLSQRRNAFKFFNTALGVRTDEDLAVVERTLRDHPPALVTFNRDDKYNTPRSLQIMETVRQHYVLLGRFDPFDVYVRP